ERRFSISEMFRGIKREMSSNASSVRITKSGALALPAGIKELHISTVRSVPITVIGEAREDIGYEMPVRSNGPDEATAKEWANRVDLKTDEVGGTLSLTTYFPPEGSQNAELTLKVPNRLAVRVENSTRIQVSGVAAVELKNPPGEVTLNTISGAVTGSHRSGDLTISGAQSVNLTLVSSRAKIKEVTTGVTVNARNGECWIGDTTGEIVASITNAELTVNMFKNTLKVTGDGSRLKVLGASHKVAVDVRRTVVDLEAAPAAGDDVTIVTSDEDIHVTFREAAAVSIDALTRGGEIRADDFKLQPVKSENEVRLNTAIGKPGSQIVLRNTRGDIVIGLR